MEEWRDLNDLNYHSDTTTNLYYPYSSSVTTNATWTIGEQDTDSNRYFICSYCREKIKDGIASDGYVYCSKRHAFLNKLKESSNKSILI